jgi:hypothetical protein
MMPFWQLHKLRHCHFGMFSFLKKRFRLGFGVGSAKTHSAEVFSGIGILFYSDFIGCFSFFILFMRFSTFLIFWQNAYLDIGRDQQKKKKPDRSG